MVSVHGCPCIDVALDEVAVLFKAEEASERFAVEDRELELIRSPCFADPFYDSAFGFVEETLLTFVVGDIGSGKLECAASPSHITSVHLEEESFRRVCVPGVIARIEHGHFEFVKSHIVVRSWNHDLGETAPCW